MAVDFGNKLIPPEEFSQSENILSAKRKINCVICAGYQDREETAFLLPGFRLNKIDAAFLETKRLGD